MGTHAKFHPVHSDYLVTMDGRVYSAKPGSKRHGAELSQWFTKDGYPRTKCDNKSRAVHRLVAETYIGPIGPGQQVNHKDFNKENNCLSNLEIISQRENLYHAMDAGVHVNPRRPVRGIHRDTGHVIEFESASAAGRAGFTQANVSHCLRGLRAVCKGYRWEYAD